MTHPLYITIQTLSFITLANYTSSFTFVVKPPSYYLFLHLRTTVNTTESSRCISCRNGKRMIIFMVFRAATNSIAAQQGRNLILVAETEVYSKWSWNIFEGSTIPRVAKDTLAHLSYGPLNNRKHDAQFSNSQIYNSPTTATAPGHYSRLVQCFFLHLAIYPAAGLLFNGNIMEFHEIPCSDWNFPRWI